MKEKRSLFEKIFEKEKVNNQNFQYFNLLNTTMSNFIPFSGNAWEMDLVRSSVDAIARNIGKLKAVHVGSKAGRLSNIENLLQYKPNPFMEAYSFYYKIATNYYIKNNSFIYPEIDKQTGKVKAFYPISPDSMELVEKNNTVFCRFRFRGGDIGACPYDEMIHLRRHFYDNDIYGSNNKAIMTTLDTIDTLNQSMSNGAKLIAAIRGILEVTTANKDEDLKKKRNDFVRDNLNIEENGSGIIVTDTKRKYTPINEKTEPIPTSQLEYVKTSIYDYYGVNEKIIQNTYNEDEWNAFYEGTLEPFSIQMGQAFTNCIFTEKERGFGNEIILEANRLQYASNSTKINVIKELTPVGMLNRNEGREIFNMGKVEDGEKYVQSLNYVNADKADKYQNVDENTKKDDKKEEGKENGKTEGNQE